MLIFPTPVIPNVGVVDWGRQYQVVSLEKYATPELCNKERDRISGEMEEAYPGDQTFMLSCFYNKNVK